MHSDLYLHLASVFTTYCIKVMVAYVAAIVLAQLVEKPRQRFLVWLGFILGAGAYWVALVLSVVQPLLLNRLPTPHPVAGAPLPSPHYFLISPDLKQVVGMAGAILLWTYLAGFLM